MPHYYSRRLHSDNFPPPDKWGLDEKILIFEDYISGWQLEPAEEVTRLSDAGFAVLRTILAYFEMIAKYEAGFDRSGQSTDFFKKGIESVFNLAGVPQNVVEIFTSKFYKEGRCALYHSGMAGFGVVLQGDREASIGIHVPSKTLIIDPLKLVRVIHEHFRAFCTRLKDPGEKDLRTNFEKRFDYEFQE